MRALTVPGLIALAKDHEITTDKLKELIAYNSQVAVENSIKAYRRALIKVQAALPIIEHNGEITYRDGRAGSYATNDAIQEVITPILHGYGFVLSFSTEYPAGMIRVTGELAHTEGHAQQSHYEARVDLSGGKTDAQGRGSIISYGHRYTTVDLLNLITRGKDNDGQVKVEPEDVSPKPDGYRDFENALRSAAVGGTSAMQSVWMSASPEMRAAAPQQFWDDIKAVAEARDADGS